MLDTYTLTLSGPIVPKARARVTSNGTFHPRAYQQWKRGAIASLAAQYRGQALSGVAVSILLRGKHSRRGDADNIAGAILDALVQAGVLQDDNLIHVKGLSVALEWSKKTEPESTIILEF